MKLRKITAFSLMFCMFMTMSIRKITVQAYDSFVSNVSEFYSAMNNPEITKINFLNDIHTTLSTYNSMEGSHKVIDGNGYSWVINTGSESSISFNNLEGTLQNIKLVSDYPIYLNYSYPAVLDKVIAPNLSVMTRSNLKISHSEISSLDARDFDDLQIENSVIKGKGVLLHLVKNMLIKDTEIYVNEKVDALYAEDTSGIIENTNIYGGVTGIKIMGYQDDIYIKNTTIEDSLSYGIHNAPLNATSTVHLNDVVIRNAGIYGVYNEQGNFGLAKIINEQESLVVIENEIRPAIFQKKAHFENYGTIQHIGNSYTLINDKLSSIKEGSVSIEKVVEDDFYDYYYSNNRTGSYVAQETRDIKTVEEFKQALENPIVSKVVLRNNLEIPEKITIESVGLFKEIIGNNKVLTIPTNAKITFNDAIIMKDLSISSIDAVEVIFNFKSGGLLERVNSTKLKLISIGKLVVKNSQVKEIDVRNADDTLIENTEILVGHVYLYKTKGAIISKSTIFQDRERQFGIKFEYSGGEVKDTKITGGIQSVLLHGYLDELYLEDVAIYDSVRNGLVNHPRNAESSVYIKNVNIEGSGSSAILNEKHLAGIPYIINMEGSTLNIENKVGFAVFQREGSFENYGNITATDGLRVITEDLSSVTVDHNRVLYLGEKDTAPGTRYYMLRSNYVDTKSPSIALVGNSNINLHLYDEYIESGVIGIDEFDGEITDYTVEGIVQTDVAGTYELTYTIKDAAGNIASTKRNVNVSSVSVKNIEISLEQTQYKFTGSPILPEPILTNKNRTLVKDVDYTVLYQNNIEIGAGKIYISGIGNYTETALVMFFITPDVSLNVIAGENRFSTASAISQASYYKADIAILVQSNNFPDALSAGPLAYALNAPILLTNTGNLSNTTAAELKRLGVKKVIILGGTSAISGNVENILRYTYQVERIEGSNRYNTAVATGKYLKSFGRHKDTVVLASGSSYADALSAGSYAAKNGLPILLTKGDVINKGTGDYLTSEGVKNVIIVGGIAVVNATVEKELQGRGITVKRLSGSDRFSTSSAIGEVYFENSTNAIVANGMEYADALAAAPYAAKMNAPIILVQQGKVSKTIESYLSTSDVKDITVVGGDAAVSQIVRERLIVLITKE